jgi:hypothetical protein
LNTLDPQHSKHRAVKDPATAADASRRRHTHLEPVHQLPRLAPDLAAGVPLEPLVQPLRLRGVAQGVVADGGLEGGEAADAGLEGDHLADLPVGFGWLDPVG